MKRRHFLQGSASALAAIGLSQTRFLQQAHRYGRVLAQETPRKLALLVGINQYPDPIISNLNGCVTDVEMQYHLLVNRFGFAPDDILMLTTDAVEDWRQPTRANIIKAFETHLIAQAKPGDVVVFHYSGHGSTVQDPMPITVEACGTPNPNGLNGTLVPIDLTPMGQSGNDIVVPDIMGRSLFLLMERIQTENLTVVLDSCFSGAGTRGTGRVRAANSRLSREDAMLVASEEELEQQRRWMKELKIEDEEAFRQRREKGIAKGTTLGSASCDQLALELPYDQGRSAGTFTYLLTSYLWQSPTPETAETLQANLIRATKAATVIHQPEAQVPIFEYKPESDHAQQPLYFLNMTGPFADGVITTVTGSQIECWLGGISPQNLKTADKGAIYSVLKSSGEVVAELVQDSRTGLYGYGKVAEEHSGSVAVGMLIREKVLTIPDPTLRIGLDPSVTDDADQARAAFERAIAPPATTTGSSISRVTVLPVNEQADVEFILARTTEDIHHQLASVGVTELPPLGAIALFAPDFSRFVPDSQGSVDEPIVRAVNRLRLRFKSLLVGRVLQELAGTSSDLQVRGEVFAPSGRGPVLPIVSRGVQLESVASLSVEPTTPGLQTMTPEAFVSGDVIQLRVHNQEHEAIFLSVLAITSGGDVVVLHPANWDAPVEAARIGPGEELVAPNADGVELFLAGNGFVELITLVSRDPLNKLLDALKGIAKRGQRAVRFVEGDSLDMLDALLSDVDEVSRSSGATVDFRPTQERTVVDSGAIAIFSTLVEVKEQERFMGMAESCFWMLVSRRRWRNATPAGVSHS